MVVKSKTFDAAHQIIDYEGKCKNLHGHTYRIEVGCLVTELAPNNIGVDFTIIGQQMKQLIDDKLDHKYLNKEFNEKNLTAEYLAKHVFEHLKQLNNTVAYVKIHETPDSFVIYDYVEG